MPPRPRRRPSDRTTRARLASVLALCLVAVGSTGTLPPAAAHEGAADPAHTYYGILGANALDLTTLTGTGVTAVSLEVGWDRLEPQRGRIDPTYAAQVAGRAEQIRAAGLDVILDAGLQYPPSWVFDVGGDTRFVNQYGDVWQGQVGARVPDAVFNPRVRRAQNRYLHRLSAVLHDGPIAAIRVGGLWYNELHYPPATVGDHRNSLWAFSPTAQAQSPVPGYRPGQGTTEETAAFLAWYLEEINDYGMWQLRHYRRAFGWRPTLQLLLPGWGVRPGDVDKAVAGGLRGATRGELTGALNEGLDWAGLLPRAATVRGHNEAYTTWVDAADQGADPVYESPVRHLVRLAQPLGLPVAGENTGTNSPEEMQRSVDRVHELGLTGLVWMNAAQLQDGRWATLDDYRRLLAP